MVSEDLSLEVQIDNVVKKVNIILGMLKSKFYSREPRLWKNLYDSLVRPHLEYDVQAWNPHLEKDIIKIEKVQRRASKIPQGFGNLSYEERLIRMNITSNRDRMVRGDLIKMYKVIRGLNEIELKKSSVLRTDIDLVGPAQEVIG